MKCKESQSLIEEYFDGELDQQSAALLSIHIENCLSCGRQLQQLALEHQAYERYERGVDASPALWSKVRGRITEEQWVPSSERRQRWQSDVSKLLSLRFGVPALALVVLSAVVGTIAVMKYFDSDRPANQIASLPASEPAKTEETGQLDGSRRSRETRGSLNESNSRDVTALRPPKGQAVKVKRDLSGPATAAQFVRDAERNYLNAIALLTRDVEQRPSQLDSETRAKLDGALASIDRTISATRKAVQKNPHDPLAVQYMLTAYAKKVDVLKEMTSY